MFADGGYPGAGAIAIGIGPRRGPCTSAWATRWSWTVAASRVSGVYHSGITYEDEGGVLPLAVAQALTGEPRETTSIAVELTPNASAAAATVARSRGSSRTRS